MMTATDLFERLFMLLGKSTDDPAILALETDEGIGPPPFISSQQEGFDVPVDGKGYGLTYRACVRADACWPPRLAEKRFVSWLHSIYFGPTVCRSPAGAVFLGFEGSDRLLVAQFND